jgi:hypothetical protein
MTTVDPISTHGVRERPWLLLAAPGSVEVRLGDLPRLAALGPGHPVALVVPCTVTRRPLRRAARRVGLVIERELIVLPSVDRPLLVVDDSPSAIRLLWRSVALVPPGVTRGGGALGLALRLARMAPTPLTGLLPPGRVLLGRMA